jgi:hypothetical protein
MTLHSDFFAVTEEEKREFRALLGPSLLAPRVMGHGVDGAKVLYLESIMRGTMEIDGPLCESRRVAWLDWHDSPWVLPIYYGMRNDLAGASHAQIGEWAQQWASVKGWQEAGLAPRDVLDMLMNLSRLAYWAMMTGRDVYLWIYDDQWIGAARDGVLPS